MNAVIEDARSPVYVLVNGHIMVNAPVAKVWPHVVDYPSWQNFTTRQHVSGKAGEEGELVLLKKSEPGSYPIPYYARTIKIEPERRIVWKVFREPGTEEDAFSFGFVDFRLEEIEGKTRFSYNLVYEFPPPAGDEEQVRLFTEQRYANFEILRSTVFPKLKIRVEGNG